MKTRVLLALALALFVLEALSKENVDGHIRSSVYELEGQLSENLEEQVVQFIGLDNIWVTVQLNVAMEDLITHLKEKSPNKPDKKKRLNDLPGLNLSPEGAFVQESVEKNVILVESGSSIDPATILAFTEGLQVTVYHKGHLDRKVERVLRSLIEEKMASLKVKVELKFNYRKAKVLESTDYDEGQKVRFEPVSFAKSFHNAVVLSFQDFLDKNVLEPFKKGLVGFALVAMIGLSLALYLSLRALNRMNSSLAGLTKAALSQSAGGQGDRHKTEGNLEVLGSAEANLDVASKAEFDERHKITDIYVNYREVVTNFFSNAMEKKDFQDIWCLSQVLGDKIILENSVLSKSKNYRDYNVFLRDNMFNESSYSDYKKLYQKLMGLMLYPEVFFLNNIRDQLEDLKTEDLGIIFHGLRKDEKGIISEIVDPVRLASLINQGIIHTSEITELNFVEYNITTLKNLDQKLAKFGQDKEEKTEDKTLEILLYLNQEQYDAHLAENNVATKLSFSPLYDLKKKEADDFFKGLKVDELCALLPMLSEDIQQGVQAILPELKLARLMQAGKLVNRQSQPLMAKLFDVLLDEEARAELRSELKKGGRQGLKVVS